MGFFINSGIFKIWHVIVTFESAKGTNGYMEKAEPLF